MRWNFFGKPTIRSQCLVTAIDAALFRNEEKKIKKTATPTRDAPQADSPLSRRFLNENAEVLLDEPKNCYTTDEIAVIRAFAAELGLDWGGVDVLRDRTSGRIYIVDANKTDMGPPVALKLGDKLKSTRRMARAFVTAFTGKRSA